MECQVLVMLFGECCHRLCMSKYVHKIIYVTLSVESRLILRETKSVFRKEGHMLCQYGDGLDFFKNKTIMQQLS